MLELSKHSSDFPATHWTLIAAVSGPERDFALSRLYQIYWRPICAQARHFGAAENEVEDVAQELFVSLFRSGAIDRADPERGRFRSYLLGALRNFLSHRRAHASAGKRGGGHTRVALEALELEPLDRAGAAGTRAFDAAWAHALLGEALRLFHQEIGHSAEGRASFTVLSGFLFGEAVPSCADAARQLGISVPAVKSRVFRLRHRLQQIVREEVARTVATPAEIDDELRYLSAVVQEADGVVAFPWPP